MSTPNPQAELMTAMIDHSHGWKVRIWSSLSLRLIHESALDGGERIKAEHATRITNVRAFLEGVEKDCRPERAAMLVCEGLGYTAVEITNPSGLGGVYYADWP